MPDARESRGTTIHFGGDDAVSVDQPIGEVRNRMHNAVLRREPWPHLTRGGEPVLVNPDRVTCVYATPEMTPW